MINQQVNDEPILNTNYQNQYIMTSTSNIHLI